MERLVIGIDISKASFTAALWDGTKALDLGEMTNDTAGYNILHTKIQEWQQHLGSQQPHLILEVTGGYELGVVAYAHSQSWAVSLPNPKQVRDWAKGEGKRAKNDRLDAQMLTLFGVKKALGFLDGRVTFVIDRERKIRHAFRSMLNAKAHIEQALNTLRTLHAASA